MTRLTDILTEQRIKVPLEATSKEGVIKELLELLAANGDLSNCRDALDVVLARERVHTTGIGMGLAMPHGKCSSVKEVVVAIGRTSKPVDFESIDGKGVSLVILVVSPIDESGLHLQALVRISRLVSTGHLRQMLENANSAEEIMTTVRQMELQPKEQEESA